MRIHYLQHVPFETLANIKVWADQNNHTVTGTHLFENAKFPSLSEFDALVVLGGPMGAYDEDKFEWLQAEKSFIKGCIQQKKMVLGICLGAQLIADVLGAKVFKNKHKEIGWLPVSLTDHGKECPLFKDFPSDFVTYHWHGDTFDLPPGARHIAYSEGCVNQAFTYNEHVLGLQFHFEMSNEGIKNLSSHCRDDIEAGAYIQQPEVMVDQTGYLQKNTELLNILLRNIESLANVKS